MPCRVHSGSPKSERANPFNRPYANTPLVLTADDARSTNSSAGAGYQNPLTQLAGSTSEITTPLGDMMLMKNLISLGLR